jgi:hypothetical protein
MDVTRGIHCRSIMDAANHPQHIGLKEAASYPGMKPEAKRFLALAKTYQGPA